MKTIVLSRDWFLDRRRIGITRLIQAERNLANDKLNALCDSQMVTDAEFLVGYGTLLGIVDVLNFLQYTIGVGGAKNHLCRNNRLETPATFTAFAKELSKSIAFLCKGMPLGELRETSRRHAALMLLNNVRVEGELED